MIQVPISIVLPIKNEAANLRRCLASIGWAEEVWVVDSCSTDSSLAIVEAEDQRRQRNELGRVYTVQFQFNGKWPKKKNWALANLPFKYEWVFIIDADEVLPLESETEIRRIVSPMEPRSKSTAAAESLKSSTDNAPVGYWINRRFMFIGRWLRHAYYPNWNLRLFKHRLGRYEKLTDVDTASGDNEVHEHVIVDGQTSQLRCEMDHYAFPSIDVFVEKHNRYSNWEARVAANRFLTQTAVQLQAGTVGWRRRLKGLSHHMPFRPLLRFCYVFFWQRGFLDGREGYYFARMHGMYELLCIAKEFELRKQSELLKGGLNNRFSIQ